MSQQLDSDHERLEPEAAVGSEVVQSSARAIDFKDRTTGSSSGGLGEDADSRYAEPVGPALSGTAAEGAPRSRRRRER